MNKKILIIGGGIAGSSLAIHLIEAGLQVRLMDKGENYSTKIAAGMVNPIVFRRMNLSWKVNHYYHQAIEFFQKLEKLSEEKLLNRITIRRFFSSDNERELWNQKIQSKAFKEFLNPLLNTDINYNSPLNIFGTGRVNAFCVDSKKYYHSTHRFIKKEADLVYDNFEMEHLDLIRSMYKNEKYDAIVFCIGYENIYYNLFDKVPTQTTKGQLITIQSDEIPENESLNRKCFLIPKGDKTFIVGATYEWNTTTLSTDNIAKLELTRKLNYVTDAKYNIVLQEAGIRPTMLDRRPVLGEHPEYKNIFMFNGLGTKGYLLAPGLSWELANHILYGHEIPHEYNISRFYS